MRGGNRVYVDVGAGKVPLELGAGPRRCREGGAPAENLITSSVEVLGLAFEESPVGSYPAWSEVLAAGSPRAVVGRSVSLLPVFLINITDTLGSYEVRLPPRAYDS